MNVKSTRVRRNPEAARAEILAAAMAALQDVRFSELTVDSLMKRTGMTRSSFYHYFSGLDEIALGMLEEFAADIRRTVDPWLMGELDEPDHRAATLTHLTSMFEVFERHAPSVAAVAQAAGSGGSSITSSISRRSSFAGSGRWVEAGPPILTDWPGR